MFQVHSLFALSNNVLCTGEMLQHVGHLITAQMSGVDADDVCRPQYVYTGKPHGVRMQRQSTPLSYWRGKKKVRIQAARVNIFEKPSL